MSTSREESPPTLMTPPPPPPAAQPGLPVMHLEPAEEQLPILAAHETEETGLGNDGLVDVESILYLQKGEEGRGGEGQKEG